MKVFLVWYHSGRGEDADLIAVCDKEDTAKTLITKHKSGQTFGSERHDEDGKSMARYWIDPVIVRTEET